LKADRIVAKTGADADRRATMAPPPLMAPPDLHMVIDAEIVGPLDAAEAMRLVGSGRAGPATLAWHPALDQWAAIERLPELAWLLRPEERPAALDHSDLARFGPRFAAGLFDTVLCSWIVILPSAALGFWPVLIGTAPDSPAATWFDWAESLVIAAYFIIPMSRIGGGATPGYRLFRLRLVEEPTRLAPGLGRTIVWYIATFGLIVGWLIYFVDSKRRMLQNLVSNTIVIALPRRPRSAASGLPGAAR
jgi:uncharacterized RDD family membrane protein YckC